MKPAADDYNELIDAAIRRIGFLGLVAGGHIPLKDDPCQGCPLHKHDRAEAANPAPGAKMLFITTRDYPARSEEAALLARITEATLSKAGLGPGDICAVPRHRCAPSGITRLDAEAVERCSRLLLSEVKKTAPRVIVLFCGHEGKKLEEDLAKSGARTVAASTLSDLMNDPAKKRQCWERITKALSAL